MGERALPDETALPNKRVQPTPLCGDKIVRILKADFVPMLILIYECGAADRNPLGAHFSHHVKPKSD